MSHLLSRRAILHGAVALGAVVALKRIPVSAQETTPNADPTVVALEREKLAWEVAKLEQETLRLQDQNRQPIVDWLRNNAVVVSGAVVALFGIVRWFAEQREDREKRDEERLAALVDGLGSPDEMARINAAHNLHTFLQPRYARFHLQILHLVAAHLQLQPAPESGDLPPFTQALISVFKNAYPQARGRKGARRDQTLTNMPSGTWMWRLLSRWSGIDLSPVAADTLGSPLDLSRVQLPGAYLVRADLARVWMPGANLKAADLRGAKLYGAFLSEADLSEAKLMRTDLRRASLHRANLSGAALSEVDVRGTDLSGANLTGADLFHVDLRGAVLRGAVLRTTRGLTRDQRQVAAERGAILDEEWADNEESA